MPRTRPAGVRRTATGVVSGVGGAGSGERIWVACSECFTFEQPAPSGQTAKASKKSETDARFVPNPNRRARTDFVARRAATMTEFDGGRMFEHRKSLKFNGESTQPLMVWRLILSVPKKSAGMGVPAWGGVEGFPPLFFRRRSRESAGSPSEAKRRLRDDLILDEARERSQVLALPGDPQLERIALVLLFEHAKRGARGGYRAGVRVGDFQRESIGLGAGRAPARSVLFQTGTMRSRSTPRSSSTSVATPRSSSTRGEEASSTCSTMSASRISASVERKDATSEGGSLRTKPTVSTNTTPESRGGAPRALLESSVAKSRSAA